MRAPPPARSGPVDVFGGLGGQLGRLSPFRFAQSDSVGPANASPGTVTRATVVGPTVKILEVARDPAWTFEPGQHVKLGLPSLTSRPYSIASAPSDPRLEFCIQLVLGGRLTPGLFSLRAGSKLELGRPKGRFGLVPTAKTHLMVATGTGIAPFRSMLRARTDSGAHFHVVHGASHAHALPYFEELTALSLADSGVSYHPTVSRPAAPENRGWTGSTGRVEPLVRELLRSQQSDLPLKVYACGNAGMIQNVRALCRETRTEVLSEPFD